MSGVAAGPSGLREAGDEQAARGDLAGARRAYEQQLDIDRRAAAANPASLGSQAGIAADLVRIGETRTRQRDFDGGQAVVVDAQPFVARRVPEHLRTENVDAAARTEIIQEEKELNRRLGHRACGNRRRDEQRCPP